ncbi:SAM-dependent methyltransferase [Streptomyces sp. NPDC021093]|uniref:SAM-dependent methyltransferase n=1 Tax=Streptomyces sp. NPDC021093 TaxID=3365112 RepID=UPI0037B86B0A
MTGTESAALPPTAAGVPAGARIDTSKPHPARVYDWFLGGKDNYPVDEALGRQIMSLDQSAQHVARGNRAFMRRATGWLAAEAGIRQFLDIGSGIPTAPNLHQIAQGYAPDARVVYADNDPVVLAHSAALLHSTPEGSVDYLQADVRSPRRILDLAAASLDLSRPVAVSLVALMHFVPDEDGAYELVKHLVDAVPSGSYLVLSQLTPELDPTGVQRGVEMYAAGGVTLAPRSRAETARFFSGLVPAGPGLVLLEDWHPELGGAGDEPRTEAPIPLYAAVARKP